MTTRVRCSTVVRHVTGTAGELAARHDLRGAVYRAVHVSELSRLDERGPLHHPRPPIGHLGGMGSAHAPHHRQRAPKSVCRAGARAVDPTTAAHWWGLLGA